MESIGEILKRLTLKGSPAVATATLSKPEPSVPPCPTCGGKGFLRLDVPVDDARFGTPVPCACKERELRERRMQSLLERSNMGGLREQTFARFFASDEQRKALNLARSFADEPDGWLILMGAYGTGKTHLAAAIINHRLTLGEPGVFIVVPDLLDHLRNTFNPSQETTYDDLFDSVRTAPLLVLDDLGTQQTTAWAQEKLFQILNHRYNNRLPTVITTNRALDDMGDRLASRMADPQISTVIAIRSFDYRTGNGVQGLNGAPSAAEHRARRARSPREDTGARP